MRHANATRNDSQPVTHHYAVADANTHADSYADTNRKTDTHTHTSTHAGTYAQGDAAARSGSK